MSGASTWSALAQEARQLGLAMLLLGDRLLLCVGEAAGSCFWDELQILGRGPVQLARRRLDGLQPHHEDVSAPVQVVRDQRVEALGQRAQLALAPHTDTVAPRRGHNRREAPHDLRLELQRPLLLCASPSLPQAGRGTWPSSPNRAGAASPVAASPKSGVIGRRRLCEKLAGHQRHHHWSS